MRTSKQNKQTFVCVGFVRGWCGHFHKTIPGAEACLSHDQHGCHTVAAGHGYSDHRIYDRREFPEYAYEQVSAAWDQHLRHAIPTGRNDNDLYGNEEE